MPARWSCLQRVVGIRGLFEVAGEECYGGLHVLGAHHLVRGVDVAAGDGERDGRDATVQALYATRIGAASRENLHLVGDVLALSDGTQVLHQLRVGDRVAVHDLDGNTFT